jgi:hypothetical protein
MSILQDRKPYKYHLIKKKNADVVFLIGARLNWILHFGKNPRFHKDVKVDL